MPTCVCCAVDQPESEYHWQARRGGRERVRDKTCKACRYIKNRSREPTQQTSIADPVISRFLRLPCRTPPA